MHIGPTEKSGAARSENAQSASKGFIAENFSGDIPTITIEIIAYGFVFGLLRDGINEWSTSTLSMLLGHGLRIIVPLLMFW